MRLEQEKLGHTKASRFGKPGRPLLGRRLPVEPAQIPFVFVALYPFMADIELALPDPAAIWRELGDFQSAVDSYVRQQTELADCLRRSHLDFCQDQKSTSVYPHYIVTTHTGVAENHGCHARNATPAERLPSQNLCRI